MARGKKQFLHPLMRILQLRQINALKRLFPKSGNELNVLSLPQRSKRL